MGGQGAGWEIDRLLARAARADRFPVVLADADLRVVWANDAMYEFGWTPEHLVGEAIFDFVHPDDLPRTGVAIGTAAQGGYVIPASVRIRMPDGSYEHLEASPNVYDDEGGSVRYAFTLRPDPFTRAKDRALTAMVNGAMPAEALDIVAGAFSSHRPGGVVSFDGDDGQREVVGVLPPALVGVFGGVQDRTPGTPWMEAERTGSLVVVDDLDRLPKEVRVAAAERGLGCGLFVCARDVGRPNPAYLSTWLPDRTEADMTGINLVDLSDLVYLALQSRATREHLDHLAHHDVLTGLANRGRFLAAVEAVVGPSGRAGPVALAYLDLDDFKAANDQHGHLAGDDLLVEVAQRFRAEVRDGDLVGRLGGDEFAVLFADGPDPDAALAVAQRVLASAAEPMAVGDDKVQLGASAGLVVASDARRVTADGLVRLADEALYLAKRKGKGTLEVVHPPPDGA